jgi:hypothetical protein
MPVPEEVNASANKLRILAASRSLNEKASLA